MTAPPTSGDHPREPAGQPRGHPPGPAPGDTPGGDRGSRLGPGASVAAAAGLIAVVTLGARAAGFLRTLAFSQGVGATAVGTVYNTVNTLPNVVYEVAAGGVLAAATVPLIASRLGAKDRAGADQIASALLTWAVTLLVPLSVVLAVAAPWLSRSLLGERAAPGSVDLGARMLVIFAPQVVLYGIGIVLAGLLQAHRRFLAAALAPLLSSIVVIAAYLVFGSVASGASQPLELSGGAVAVLAGGTTLGVVVLSLPLLVPVRRAGVRLRPTWSFPDGAARRATGLAGVGVIALVAQQAAVLVVLWLTNQRAGTGTVTVYTYVQAVYLLPYAVLAVPVATSAFPALALAEGAARSAAGAVATSLRAIVLLCGGAVAVLIAVSGPLGVFFARLDQGGGREGQAALAALPETVVAYAPGLLGFGMAALLTRALYVRGRPWQAAAAMAAGWLTAALWPLLLLPEDAGPAGTLRSLGVASSAGMTLSAALLTWLVVRSWGAAAVAGSGRSVGAAVVSLAFAAGVGDLVAHLLDPTSLGGAVLAGVLVAVATLLVYLVGMAIGDTPTMRAALEQGRSRRRRS